MSSPFNPNSSRDELSNKRSAYVPLDVTPVKQVWNLQLTAAPITGDQFYVTPHTFRMTSASTPGFVVPEDNLYYIPIGANISAAMSAISANLNLASETNVLSLSAGVDAATATGSRTDITITADLAGQQIETLVLSGSGIVFTETTGNTGGQVLPEGYIGYITSAGNTVNVSNPAEMTRQQVISPSKPN